MQRVRVDGDAGLVHRGRGKPSNRKIPEKVKAKVLRLYAQRYGDFGPTLAAEKLAERHGITLSDETVRLWLHARGISLSAADAPAPGVARAEAPCGGVAPAGWLAPRLVGGPGTSRCVDGVHR